MWAVNMLAREVTRWNTACDKRLHRLISYLYHTKDKKLTCMVGDTAENCMLALFSDASFAGDLKDSKSTSGAFLALVGPRTFVPITWLCKKQTAVSHSSTEAEIVSLDAGVRMEGLPATMLWDQVIQTLHPSSKNIGKFKEQNKPDEAMSLLQYLELSLIHI